MTLLDKFTLVFENRLIFRKFYSRLLIFLRDIRSLNVTYCQNMLFVNVVDRKRFDADSTFCYDDDQDPDPSRNWAKLIIGNF